MKPIRILHVLGGLDLGGAESFVMNLYRAIDKDVVQFDFVKHIEKKGAFEDEIIEQGGRIFKCPKYTGKNHFAYCRWWNEFLKNHKEYHIIHGHVRSTAALYLRIAEKYGITTIAHSHSTSNGSGFSAFVKNIMQYPIRNIADYLLACSDEAGKWLYGKDIISKENYYTIPNGINLDKFAFDEKKRQTMRLKLNIKPSDFVLGHVGRMVVPKNHKFLVQLFSEYHKRNKKSKLLLVGDGELFEIIKNQCNKLGLSKDVIMPGNKINTEDYYQAMDLFVFPSLWEGLGIVAIEAQANGLPCLVSENVPKDVLLTNKIKALPLDSVDSWLQSFGNIAQINSRINFNDNIDKYNINKIAKQIQIFYLKQTVKRIKGV